MEQWVGRVALVTGASAGIGRAIAESLVEAGMTVIGAARRFEKLEELAKELDGKKGKLIPIKCDLEKDEDVYNMFEVAEKEYGGVDVLVNNAGKIHHTSLLNGTPEIWRSMQNLNVIALALCSQLAIKSMRARGVNDGHVVMISSDSSYVVHNFGFVRFYCATKFALRAYTIGLRQEMKEIKSGIRISSVLPGAVDTELWNDVSEDPEFKSAILGDVDMLKPKDIAASVIHVLAAPQRVEIHDVYVQPTVDNTFA